MARMRSLRLVLTLMCVSVALLLVPRPAHAIDKRLRMMMKTAGYGAGAGLVIGAGTAAMGMGGMRNALMGASAGLYAGILLAGYIIATPPEDEGRRGGNPYAPRKPVGPGDYDEDEEGLEKHLPPKRDDDSRREVVPSVGGGELVASGLDSAEVESGAQAPMPSETVLWAPLVTLSF